MMGKIIGSLISILLVVGVVIGVMVVLKSLHEGKDQGQNQSMSMKMVTTICQPTTYKDACVESLQPAALNSSSTLQDYIKSAMDATLFSIIKSCDVVSKKYVNGSDAYTNIAIKDCNQLLINAIETLHDSLSMVNGSNIHTLQDRADELLSWMTSVYALQTTCIDQIEDPEFKSAIQNSMVNATQLTHNAVNIVAELDNVIRIFVVPSSATKTGRRLMSSEKTDGYPAWVGATERKLLWKPSNVRPNVVVAKDGSGHFTTINQAVNAYPKNLRGRFVIHVKSGVYNEQVIIDKSKMNIFMYGDGIGRTIVTGKKSFKSGVTTMNTATFGVVGDGFIGQGMTFRNDAGPDGHQAVAFRSQADKTVMFDCSFEANQDTLYYQVKRQFYKNCNIYGTVDFIFGKGDAVIQDSNIIVRRPLPGQFNTITADGKEIVRSSGGLVIQNCRIIPDNFLFPIRFKVPTFLGRPWKAEALTVVMENEIGDFIRPEGWMIWQGSNNAATCQMYEFDNRGPGSTTNRRNRDFKKWRLLSRQDAARYAPGQFLAGAQWIPQSGVPVKLGL